MANIQAIRDLARQDWSQRRIGRELGMDRETVARYLAVPKPAKYHQGKAIDASVIEEFHQALGPANIDALTKE